MWQLVSRSVRADNIGRAAADRPATHIEWRRRRYQFMATRRRDD